MYHIMAVLMWNCSLEIEVFFDLKIKV